MKLNPPRRNVAATPSKPVAKSVARETPPPRRYPKYKILNFDRLDYCSCLANLEEVASLPNYKFVKGDICSADLVNYVLETEKIDTIMHFAAQTHVDNSFGNSFQFTRNNFNSWSLMVDRLPARAAALPAACN